jgi:PAS domain S-box-containing protein
MLARLSRLLTHMPTDPWRGRVEDAVARWCRGDFSQRLPADAPLATGLNAMADELAEHRRERQEAAEAILRAEARYRSIIDTAQDAMVVMDEAGIIQSFNRAAEGIFGYAGEEVVGRDVSVLMPQNRGSNHGLAVAKYLRGGPRTMIGSVTEVPARRKDGTVFPVEISVAEWRDGERRHFTGIMRDVTKWKEAERRIGDSYALLNSVVESIGDPIFAKDRAGRYIVANTATAVALGRRRQEVLGHTDAELLEGPLAESLRSVDRAVMDSRLPAVTEEEISAGKACHHYLSLKTPLRDGEGRVVGIVGSARDISGRKLMEEQLKAAKEEAERANRAKSSFLAAASHDLRQPVQAMVLLVSALSARLRSHPTAAVVDKLRRALDALQTLLEGLLDISRLDAGVVEARPQPMPLGALLERLAGEYRMRAAAAGLELRAVYTSAWVNSDPALLERILRNLLENAIRYTPRGGVLMGCRRRGGDVLVQVADTGIGIPADQQERVFQEFVQMDNAARDRGKGLGLGLSIVRRLAGLLGHGLDLRSQPGRGSVFSLTLPRAEPLGMPKGEVAALPADMHGLVLVIDDEAIIRHGLEVLLSDWGCEVVTAGDGDEAVRWVHDHHRRPDVVLADYRLRQGATGVGAVAAVRTACNFPVPGIIITGDTDPDRIVEVTRSGHRIAHKPVVAEKLRELIASAQIPGPKEKEETW